MLSNSNETLESIITRYVHMSSPNVKGWRSCVHTSCDHGKKGPRAAFVFSNDGSVAFHCFNCGVKTGYSPSEHQTMPRKMAQVLTDFNIPHEDWQAVVFNNMSADTPSSSKQTQHQSIEPKILEIPNQFYYLNQSQDDDKWAIIAKHFLQTRGIDSRNYPFLLCKKTNNKYFKKWMGRVIIPIFKNKKPIFYIGRDLTGKQAKKYESPATDRTGVFYGFDFLFENCDAPLYVVEGWFDAYPIGGVAILGNELSPSVIQWLNKSPRQKVYVPDKKGNGMLGAYAALQHGWSVSIPDIGSNCKDINDAVVKYGKMYVIKSLIDNTCSGFDAQVKIELLLEK